MLIPWIGETLEEERESEKMTEVVLAQLKEVINVLKETSWSNFKILPVQVPAAHG